MIEGKLLWNGKSLQVQYQSKKGKDTIVNPKQEAFSAAIVQKQSNSKQAPELHEQAVEIELGPNGQPSSVSLKGEAEVKTTVELKLGDFHNPYNFVPALDRSKVTGELGDRRPDGHHVYRVNRWSGSLSVTMTVVTPLLIPDAGRSSVGTDPSHKILPLRMLDGKPYLAPTGVKGMLRSAYEAVTNSRLSVFEGHKDRLAFRLTTDNAKQTCPAMVVQREDGKKVLLILEAPGVMADVGRLPRYQSNPAPTDRDKGASRMSLKYHGTPNIPQNGDPVWVRLNPNNRYENDLPSSIRSNLPGKEPLNNLVTRIHYRGEDVARPTGEDWRKGWVYISGANIGGKVYERVFLEGDDRTKIPQVIVDESLEKMWEELILNYQKTNEKTIKKRNDEGASANDYLGSTPGKTAFSRHTYTEDMVDFKVGTLCYVELKSTANKKSLMARDIVGILPVTLSRQLYTTSPEDFLDQSLKPATEMKELSPADRVFGWVSQKGLGQECAYKGQLRVHQVNCITAETNAVQLFSPPLPLAILGAPKPQQARFYLAMDKHGTALKVGGAKEVGYQDPSRQGLRGRKVYPHHQKLPSGYWNKPLDDRTQKIQDGHYQEYRRPKKNGQEQQDSQNRSITGWVNPGTQFTFKIDVVNLSEVELGALLYLLTLPLDYFHRLGGGKPLGFGSVRLKVDEKASDLRMGSQWCHFYESLEGKKNEPIDIKGAIEAFKKAVTEAYGDFEKAKFIQVFVRSAQGSVGPVHYPRVTAEPTPDGESFKWFVQNEQGTPQDKRRRIPGRSGRKLSLPNLGSSALPMDSTSD